MDWESHSSLSSTTLRIFFLGALEPSSLKWVLVDVCCMDTLVSSWNVNLEADFGDNISSLWLSICFNVWSSTNIGSEASSSLLLSWPRLSKSVGVLINNSSPLNTGKDFDCASPTLLPEVSTVTFKKSWRNKLSKVHQALNSLDV